jgi:hypothetical protein
MLEKQPFQRYKFDEEKDQEKGKVFTIRLNEEEQRNLRQAQNLLQQEKTSTALKQLALFGMYVLHDRSTAHILQVLNDNIRKNKRIGIEKVEIKP